MLRRDLPLADRPDRWLLISQVEHARISGELARQWGNATFPSLVTGEDPADPSLSMAREEWLMAVACHDDGWAGLEADPPVDPVLGRPYSFLDMPREESLRVWSDSIQLARRYGVFAGWTVAAHFMSLLRDSDDADTRRARQWLVETSSLADAWLDEWKRSSPRFTDQLAREALLGIQAFDWLSLWLCLEAPAIEGDQLAPSRRFDQGLFADCPLELNPETTQEKGESRVLRVSPWPFKEGEITLEALGYAVPMTAYQSTDELVERRIPMRIAWQLLPR